MTKIEKETISYLRCEGLGYKAIASRLGFSENTVKGYCRRNGLTGEVPAQISVCRHCGIDLPRKAKGKQKKFCSDACRLAWWNAHPFLVERRAYYPLTCAHCGNEFDSYGNSGRKYCSHACYISARFGKGAAV